MSLFNCAYSTSPSPQILLGPSRVFPGRLSVSRTFGDVEAKMTKFGGLPNVVIAIPEIMSFSIDSDCDFLVIGCDGIYDQMSNKDVVECIWMPFKDNKAKNIHAQCSLGVDMVIKTSLARNVLDNVTCVMIAFENFEKIFESDILKNSNDLNAPLPNLSNGASNVISNKNLTPKESKIKHLADKELFPKIDQSNNKIDSSRGELSNYEKKTLKN